MRRFDIANTTRTVCVFIISFDFFFLVYIGLRSFDLQRWCRVSRDWPVRASSEHRHDHAFVRLTWAYGPATQDSNPFMIHPRNASYLVRIMLPTLLKSSRSPVRPRLVQMGLTRALMFSLYKRVICLRKHAVVYSSALASTHPVRLPT